MTRNIPFVFKALLPVAAIAILSTQAFAQDVSADIDVNADGMYSLPELQAAMPEMTEDAFVVLDANGDGLLNAEEVAAGVEAGLLPS